MERTQSMLSHAMRTSETRSVAPTGTFVGSVMETSDRSHAREYGLGRRPNMETASDTSSQRERKFANLLGGSDTDSDVDMGMPSARNVGHRLYFTGCGRERVKQERLREERERLLMTEMSQMTQRPNITSRARTKMGKGEHFADHAAMWSAQRDQRLRRKAVEVARERLSELRATPALNPRSEHLLQTSGEYKGPVRHWNEHFAKFSARRHRDEHGNKPGAFQPNINANAVRVDVERSISERLYEDSSSRRERLQMRAHEQQARELVDPATGRPLFQPHALRRSASQPHRDPEELAAALHDESYEIARRRELRTENSRDENCTFKPHINETSEELAPRARKPLYVPRAQRLEEERKKKERRSKSAEPTPRIGDSHKGPVSVDEFLRRAQRNEMTRAQKLDAIRREQDDRELGECTFQPAISRRSESIFYASNASGTPMRGPFEGGSPLPTERSTMSAPQYHYQQTQSPRSAHGASPTGGRSPHNPSTARAAASPVRTQPSPKSFRGRATTADEFAAVMAGAGLAGDSPVPNPAGATQYQRSPARAAEAVPADASPARSGYAASAPRAASQPGGAGVAGVDEYIAQFESQMYSVLEEWRKLEEV